MTFRACCRQETKWPSGKSLKQTTTHGRRIRMLKILKSRVQTAGQDRGRGGSQKYGGIASRAMDPYAHRLANLLVGNKERAARRECTLVGPAIELLADTVIALCGGDLSPKLDGQAAPMCR